MDIHLDLIRLIKRSPALADDWRQCSEILWNFVVRTVNDHKELFELDEENKRIRLSPEGKIVERWIK